MNDDIQRGRERPVRKNGLVNSLNPYQTISWIYTLTDIIIAYIFSILIQEPGIHELLLILLQLFGMNLCIFSQHQLQQTQKQSNKNYNEIFLKATLMDPTDPIVKQDIKCKQQGKELKTDFKSYCLVCQAHAQDKTKHYWSCNKCVQDNQLQQIKINYYLE